MLFVTKLVFVFPFKGVWWSEEKNRFLIKTGTVLLKVQWSLLGETSKLQHSSERKQGICYLNYLPEALRPSRSLLCSFVLSHLKITIYSHCYHFCIYVNITVHTTIRDFMERNSVYDFVVITLTPSQVTYFLTGILTNQMIFLKWERLGHILVIFSACLTCSNDYYHFVTTS